MIKRPTFSILVDSQENTNLALRQLIEISLEGEDAMCTLFNEIAKEHEAKGEVRGKLFGRAEGIIETGLDFGLSKDAILEQLQKKLDISLEIAEEYFKTFSK